MTNKLFITHPLCQPTPQHQRDLQEAGCAVVVCGSVPVNRAVLVDLQSMFVQQMVRPARPITQSRPSLN